MRFHSHTTDRQITLGLIILGVCSLVDLFIPNLSLFEISPNFFFAALGAAIALPIDLAYFALFAPIFLISIPLLASRAVYAGVALTAFAISFFLIRKYLARGSYAAVFLGGFSLSLISTGLLFVYGFVIGNASLTATHIFVVALNGILTGALACGIRALVGKIARF